METEPDLAFAGVGDIDPGLRFSGVCVLGMPGFDTVESKGDGLSGRRRKGKQPNHDTWHYTTGFSVSLHGRSP
jgi:hypothetical protein